MPLLQRNVALLCIQKHNTRRTELDWAELSNIATSSFVRPPPRLSLYSRADSLLHYTTTLYIMFTPQFSTYDQWV